MKRFAILPVLIVGALALAAAGLADPGHGKGKDNGQHGKSGKGKLLADGRHGRSRNLRAEPLGHQHPRADVHGEAEP